MLYESLDDANDLRARLSTAEDDFGKALALRAGVVHPREADVFEMKVLDAPKRFGRRQFARFVGR